MSADSPMRREAFERLLGELRPKLHRYGARMTGSVIDGEDVVQEAILKALEAFGEEQVANPEGWLFRITHNAALDHLRRRDVAEQHPAPELIGSEAVSEVSSAWPSRMPKLLPKATPSRSKRWPRVPVSLSPSQVSRIEASPSPVSPSEKSLGSEVKCCNSSTLSGANQASAAAAL